MSRAPFLKWALSESLFWVMVITGAVLYASAVSGEGKVAGAVVLAGFAFGSGYAGLLAWREEPSDENVDFAIRAVPMLALLGTSIGFLIAFSAPAADLPERITGASTALAATVLGIAGGLTLMLQQRILGDRKRGCGCAGP